MTQPDSNASSSPWHDEFDRIFDAALDAVIAVDHEGRIIGWNKSATAIFGWTKEEATSSKLIESIIPIDQVAKHVAGMQRYLKTGQAKILDQRVEVIACNKGGKQFPVELSVSEIVQDGRRFFLGFVRDITQQRRLSDDIAESHDRMRLILNSTEEAIYGVDLNGNCMFCNASCVRQLGYDSEEDLLGKNMHELIHHTHHDGTTYSLSDCPIYQTHAESEGVRIENEVFWSKDGTSFPVDYRSQPIIRNGKRIGIVVTFVDITERREDAAYRARMAALVDSSYDAIIGKDLDGRITSWNLGAQRVYGYTEQEAVGEHINLLLPDASDQEEPEIANSVRTGQRLEQFETLRRRKNGEIFSVSLTVSPIADESGNVIGSSTIERDISERKLQEDELKRAKDIAENAHEKAQEALSVRSEFLANVSHELRTPMSAILGMLQIALDEELTPALRDYLSTAQDSASTLLVLLNDILDFSRMESGKFTVESAPFRLRPMLDEAMKTISASAFRKGLELACEVSPDVPDELIGDEVRLRQIIINLVGNAVKFTQQGEVAVTVAVIRRWPNEVRLKFSVRDTGCGISADDQKKIFDAFTQADSSSTRDHGGVGLGLAICSELLRRMGSRIRLKSEEGQGSTFSFVLSLPRAEELKRPETSIPIDRLRGLSVLVVDDNETNRRILDQSLTSWEMRPTSTGSGRHALELAREASKSGDGYALAIVDALMPEMDGLSLVNEINSDAEIPTPPVILMTSSADRASIAEDDKTISTLLAKPVTQSDLLDAIVRCLNVSPPENLDEVLSTDDAPAQPLRILLAEDTPANQKVITSILNKRGHEVIIAPNGREAVEQAAVGQFDVILMDVQMPIMDGLQATAAIRANEAGSQSQIPVIAMTAHAMRGDREKCLQAGMDAYLSKPINVEELLEMVESVSSERDPTTKQGEPQAVGGGGDSWATPDPSVMDLKATKKRIRGDEELLCELIEVFAEDSPELLEGMKRAIEQQDRGELERCAHTLKGLAANFEATKTMEAAKQLEELGGKGEFSAVHSQMPELEAFVEELTSALTRFRTTLKG